MLKQVLSQKENDNKWKYKSTQKNEEHWKWYLRGKYILFKNYYLNVFKDNEFSK